MPAILDSGARDTGCILSEPNGHRGRANIVIAAGAGILAPNTVLAKVTASGKYVTAKATGSDGSQTAAAVLLYGVDATAGDVWVAGLVRDAEVNGKTLVYDPSISSQALRLAKDAELAAAGIIVR